MEAHNGVEVILIHDFHFHSAQQLSNHDVLVNALPVAERLAHVFHLFPILERGPLIVAPEFRAGIERTEIDQSLDESALFPIGGSPHRVLIEMKCERV